jgi:hypothetical protein
MLNQFSDTKNYRNLNKKYNKVENLQLEKDLRESF